MEKHNTVHAIFASGAKTAEIIDDVWQYDFGQTLQISGLSLPPIIEIHYANKGRDTAIPQVGVTKDGITTAPIPNEILSEKGAFTAYIFVTDGESGETCYTINGYVNKRPPVEGFNTPEDQEILHAAVGAVNAAAERAESAETKATAAANQTTKDAEQTAADRAEVEGLVESVSGIGEQVTKVENLTKQAQTSATNAALSEQAAKTAETNAQAAQAGAETAEGNAELAERNAKASEQAVEKAKQLVTQMGQEVLDNKNHIDQTAQAFDQTAQQAVANVNNAGQTQTERVQSAGNTATESVETAQTAATQAVEAAKAGAVKAVQTEGTTQTGNVTAEGAKQVRAVRAAAQEIVADREQITQNKADIAEIKEEMDNLSPAIVDTATGESIVVEDSSDNRFKGLSLYGKSTQVTTTGAQLKINNDDITKTWKSTEAITENPIKFEIDSNSDLSTGGFLSFYSDSDIPDAVCYEPYIWTENGTEGKWGNKTYFKITKGLNKVEIKAYSIKPADSERLMIQIRRNTETLSYNGTFTLSDVFIKSGQNEAPYEPYTGGKPSPSVEYPQEIANAGDKGNIGVDVYGGNLFDIDAEPFEGRRNDYIFENNAIYKDNIAPYKAIRYHIKVPPKTRLRLSVDVISNSTTVQVSNYKEGGTTVNASIRKPNRETIFETNEHEKLVVSIYNFEEGMLKAGNIMVGIAGEAKTIFEPYKPVQTLTIPTPNGLPGIKVDSGGNYTDMSGQQWVCDEIDLERGKYVQRIAENVWDTVSFTDTGSGKFQNNTLGAYKLKGATFASMANFARYSAWANESGGFAAFDKYFYYHHGSEIKVEELNELFNSKAPIKIIGQLETPTERDLSSEEIQAYKALHTNYPTTVIMNDENAGMKVSYVADTKNYINKKFEELNAKIVNTQIALL
nr:MAG TPA: L SHAPED TAIL FIBER PROTEIN [Caudoviricetes sp.]